MLTEATQSEIKIGKARFPETIVLDWADYCNLKCMFCWRDQFEKERGGKGGFVPFEKIKRLEKPLRAAKYLLLSSGIGEPLLHPELAEILPWVFSVNPDIRLRITTNGTALTADKASLFAGRIDWLSISLNASHAEAYMRDMYPHEFKRGIDGTSRWNYFIRRLTSFIEALPPEDRGRIRIQGVTHRDNIADMSDFVRLTARMGAFQAVITPMHIREPEQIDLALYWIKDAYNDAVDAAAVVGAELGVRVEAARFYTYPKLTEFKLDEICREPLDVAYISKGPLAAPCCHWTDTHIPCEVYDDDDAFDRFWNHDIFQRLRKKRDFRSCEVCEITRVFDEAGSHFAPLLRRQLSDTGRIGELDGRGFYADAGLVRACARNRLDLPSLRRTLRSLQLSTEALQAIESEGLAALPALDRIAWDKFRESNAPFAPADISLAGCIVGIGWGGLIHEPHNRVSARWLGGGQQASLFLRVPPSGPLSASFVVHHISSPDLTSHLQIGVGAVCIETTVGVDRSGRTVLNAIIPRQLVMAHDGCLWLRVGCLDPHDATPAGNISFMRVLLERHQPRLPQSLRRRTAVAGGTAARAAYEFARTVIWHPLRNRHPGLTTAIAKAALASPLRRYLKR